MTSLASIRRQFTTLIQFAEEEWSPELGKLLWEQGCNRVSFVKSCTFTVLQFTAVPDQFGELVHGPLAVDGHPVPEGREARGGLLVVRVRVDVVKQVHGLAVGVPADHHVLKERHGHHALVDTSYLDTVHDTGQLEDCRLRGGGLPRHEAAVRDHVAWDTEIVGTESQDSQ